MEPGEPDLRARGPTPVGSRWQRNFLRLIMTLSVVASLLVACSMVRLAYDNAGWLMVRWADDYLRLDSQQEAALRLRLQAVMDRHRQALLPETIRFLRSLVRSLDQRMSPSEARCVIRWSQDLYRRTAKLMGPVAAETLAGLSPAQVDYLAERIQEQDRKFRDKYLQGTTQQRRNRRAGMIVERLENWSGELSERQVRLVYRRTIALPDTAPGWYRYRGAQQMRLLAALRAGADSAMIQGLLEDWWVDQRDQPEVLRREVETFLDGFALMISTLNRSFESWQRQRVTNRLSAIADDLAEMLPAGSSAPAAMPSAWTRCTLDGSG